MEGESVRWLGSNGIEDNSLKRQIIVLGLLSILASALGADAPLGTPTFRSTVSIDGSTQIDSNPVKKTITAYSLSNGQRGQLLWEISEWSRWIDISTDGEFCVVDVTGGLLAQDFKMDEQILKIFELGTLVKVLSIRDLLCDPLELRRTVSHYSWNREIQTNGNSFTIWTVDSKIVVSRDPIATEKFPISDEEKRERGVTKSSGVSRVLNWFAFIGK